MVNYWQISLQRETKHLKISEFKIAGPKLLHGTRHQDSRGYFSETYNEQKFVEIGLPKFVQDNLSISSKDVFRGLHWQLEPRAQGKLVTCLRGSIDDYIVDIRLSSPTFGQSLKVRLGDSALSSFWVPAGFAHGFHALEDDTLVSYKVTDFWSSDHERSMRVDPSFDINIKIESLLMSQKDAVAPTLGELWQSPADNFFI
jgi:dTDP-4-dehydrorhamnose 3,5-epimerase